MNQNKIDKIRYINAKQKNSKMSWGWIPPTITVLRRTFVWNTAKKLIFLTFLSIRHPNLLPTTHLSVKMSILFVQLMFSFLSYLLCFRHVSCVESTCMLHSIGFIWWNRRRKKNCHMNSVTFCSICVKLSNSQNVVGAQVLLHFVQTNELEKVADHQHMHHMIKEQIRIYFI